MPAAHRRHRCHRQGRPRHRRATRRGRRAAAPARARSRRARRSCRAPRSCRPTTATPSRCARRSYPGDRVFMVADAPGRRGPHRVAPLVHPGRVRRRCRAGRVPVDRERRPATRSSRTPWSHRATEELLEAAPVPHAFLRMNLFLDDLPLWFDADGICRGPAGDGRVALISRADVAAVAAEVLASDGYLGETLDLSGDEAPTIAEFAAVCSELTGRDAALRARHARRLHREPARARPQAVGRGGRRRLLPGRRGGRAGRAVRRRPARHRPRAGARPRRVAANWRVERTRRKF